MLIVSEESNLTIPQLYDARCIIQFDGPLIEARLVGRVSLSHVLGLPEAEAYQKNSIRMIPGLKVLDSATNPRFRWKIIPAMDFPTELLWICLRLRH